MRYFSGISAQGLIDQATETVREMVSIIDPEAITQIFSDKQFICAGSGDSTPNLITSASDDNFSVAFNGELYYLEAGLPPADYMLKLLKSTEENAPNIEEIASAIEGVFVVVIFDKRLKKVHFITDRLGLRFTYIYLKNGQLFWSSEPKSFLVKSLESPRIDAEAMHEFLTHGAMKDCKTMLKGVELLPPGSVVTYDLVSDTLKSHTYWTWNPSAQEKKLSRRETNDLVDKITHQFKKSVAERSKSDGNQLGLFLSGGLDSRAILGGIEFPGALPTFTFGKKGSLDEKIAQNLANYLKTEHHFFEIHSQNWLEPRLKAVWWLDGQYNLLHMHGVEALGYLTGKVDIIFNGMVQSFIRGHDLSNYDGNYPAVIGRIRRFNRYGTYMDDKVLLTRFPFYDYKLLDMLSEIPANIRRADHFYHKLLLRSFKDLFQNFPDSNVNTYIGGRFARLRNFYKRVLIRLGVTKYEYHDYPKWIRESKSIFLEFLGEESKLRRYGYDQQISTLLAKIDH
jgi:asparagine synthase (glutamine-hydrolysing)